MGGLRAARRMRSAAARPPPPAGSAKVPELARPPARPSRAAAVTRRPAPVRTPLQRQVGARPPAGGRGGVCMYACGRGCCTTGPPFPRSAGAAFRCPHAESLKRVERRKNTTQNPKPSHFSPPPQKKITAEGRVTPPPPHRCRFASAARSPQPCQGRPLRQPGCRCALWGGRVGKGVILIFFFSFSPFFAVFSPAAGGAGGCGRRGGQRLPAPARCHLLQPPLWGGGGGRWAVVISRDK